jgi:VanZ family protein
MDRAGENDHRRTATRLVGRPRVRAGLALLAGVAVVVGSLLPAPAGSDTSALPLVLPGADKLVHGLAYAVLTVATAAAVSARNRRTLLVVAGLAVVLGAGVELAQTHVPTRTGDAFDLLANAVGAAVGAGLWWWYVDRTHRE